MSAYVGTQIIGRMAAMLAGITRAGGYHTDLGRHVAVGDVRRNPDDVPGVVVMPGRETASPAYGLGRTVQQVRVAAALNRLESRVEGYSADPGAPWVLVGAIVSDLRKCLETRDSTLAGLVEHIGYSGTDAPLFGDSGGELVAVDVLFEVRFATAKGVPDLPL